MFYIQKLQWYNATKRVKLSECIKYNSYPKTHTTMIRGDFLYAMFHQFTYDTDEHSQSCTAKDVIFGVSQYGELWWGVTFNGGAWYGITETMVS